MYLIIMAENGGGFSKPIPTPSGTVLAERKLAEGEFRELIRELKQSGHTLQREWNPPVAGSDGLPLPILAAQLRCPESDNSTELELVLWSI